MKKKEPKWKQIMMDSNKQDKNLNGSEPNRSDLEQPKLSNTELLYNNVMRNEITTYIYSSARRKIMQREFKRKNKLKINQERPYDSISYNNRGLAFYCSSKSRSNSFVWNANQLKMPQNGTNSQPKTPRHTINSQQKSLNFQSTVSMTHKVS